MAMYTCRRFQANAWGSTLMSTPFFSIMRITCSLATVGYYANICPDMRILLIYKVKAPPVLVVPRITNLVTNVGSGAQLIALCAIK